MPIKEEAVVDAVATWLQEKGYSVKTARVGGQGFDIEATGPADRWVIEAKGGAHSGADASSAASASVGAAFMTGAAWAQREALAGVKIGIAVPRSHWFDIHVARIDKALALLNINVIRVDDELNVTIDGGARGEDI